MLMRMRKRILVAVAALAGFVTAQVNDYSTTLPSVRPDQLEASARTLLKEFDRRKYGANGAPQVSQLADETTVPMLYILAKQNNEIIRLLKKLANEK